MLTDSEVFAAKEILKDIDQELAPMSIPKIWIDRAFETLTDEQTQRALFEIGVFMAAGAERFFSENSILANEVALVLAKVAIGFVSSALDITKETEVPNDATKA